MKKAYIGIDAHKESNTLALAFAGNEPPQLYGKLIFRGMHPNKIRVAIARELSTYIWDLAHIID